jgi:hypothetical protein
MVKHGRKYNLIIYKTENMIQANELRLGNYIVDMSDRILEVGEIKEYAVRCQYEGLSNTGIENVRNSLFNLQDGLFGIEISHEILLKAGFEHKGLYPRNQWEQEERYLLYNVIDGTSSFLVVKVMSCYGNTYTEGWEARIDNDVIWTKELKYVHQLQNLFFAIAGYDLTIEISNKDYSRTKN